MATTIKVIEGAPEFWPRIFREDDPEAEHEVEPQLRKTVNAAWQRIESYIAWRWGERECVFTVEGPGDWTPPLQPATITSAEIWRDDAWQEVTLRPTPLGGLLLPECAFYRIEATVGDAASPPRAVTHAVALLAQYMTAVNEIPRAERTATSYSTQGSAVIRPDVPHLAEPATEYRVERSQYWISRALQLSGAADFLRPWRNLGGGSGGGGSVGAPDGHDEWSTLQW